MNNKTKTYLLLAVVLGIWGAIGYQIIGGISSDDSAIVAPDFDATFNPKTTTERDPFSIQKTQRDPFLGTLVNNTRPKVTTKNTAIKPKAVMPPVSYNGLIKKQRSSDQVFVVNINNKQHLLKQGQTADSITLVRGNAKTIVVRYHNRSQTIKRQ